MAPQLIHASATVLAIRFAGTGVQLVPGSGHTVGHRARAAHTRVPLETATATTAARSQKEREAANSNSQAACCVLRADQAERGAARQRARDPGRGHELSGGGGTRQGTGRQRDQFGRGSRRHCGREELARSNLNLEEGWLAGTSSGGEPCDFADEFGMEEEEAGQGTHLGSCRACDVAAEAAPPPRRRRRRAE
jgi:hypothetical protein